MWFLIGEGNVANMQVWLPPGAELMCGRTDCDITVSNDKSVSRKHAIIALRAEHDGSSGKFVPYIKDVDAKYGTFINGVRLQGERPLNDGDRIRLGGLKTVFRLRQRYATICFSKLNATLSAELTRLVASIGIYVSPQWDRTCQLLVMEQLILTEKVISALQQGVPIVSVAWVRTLLSNIQERGRQGLAVLPPVAEYLPPAQDEAIKSGMDFTPDPNRSKLFADKHFIIFSPQQFEQLRAPITGCGGQMTLCRLDDQAMRSALSIADYCKQWTQPCIVEPDRPQDVELVRRAAQHMSLYSIRKQDITLAILYNSTAVYCNPKHLNLPATKHLNSDTAATTTRPAGDEKKSRPTLQGIFDLVKSTTSSKIPLFDAFLEESPRRSQFDETSSELTLTTERTESPLQSTATHDLSLVSLPSLSSVRSNTTEIDSPSAYERDTRPPTTPTPCHPPTAKSKDKTVSRSSTKDYIASNSSRSEPNEQVHAVTAVEHDVDASIKEGRCVVVTSADLIVASTTIHPTTPTSDVPNFKRFRKSTPQTRTAFIPLSLYKSGFGAGVSDEWLTTPKEKSSSMDGDDIFGLSDASIKAAIQQATRKRRAR